MRAARLDARSCGKRHVTQENVHTIGIAGGFDACLERLRQRRTGDPAHFDALPLAQIKRGMRHHDDPLRWSRDRCSDGMVHQRFA